jgi:RNA polymerase sigma-70 factor (ECF subfamily)
MEGRANSQESAGPDQVTPLSLLERVRASDPEAWRRLVELYQPMVLFWCRRGGVQGDDREDVAQEVFAAAAAGMAEFHRDRPGDTFRGWLRGITRNLILLYFRNNQGRPRARGGSDVMRCLEDVADPLPGPPEDDDEEQAELSQLYRRAISLVRGQFEERTWQAFWLSVIEGRPVSSVAEELGMKLATVRQAKSRVLRCLKREVGYLLD